MHNRSNEDHVPLINVPSFNTGLLQPSVPRSSENNSIMHIVQIRRQQPRIHGLPEAKYEYAILYYTGLLPVAIATFPSVEPSTWQRHR